MYLVMVNKDNLPQDVILVTTDRDRATEQFLETCSELLSNWDAYTQDDKDILLDQGYELFGNNESIVLVDTDGPTSDADIRDQLTKQPSGDMTVAEIVESGEVALTEGMTVDQMLELCGRNLDAANSWDIQGQVLFKGSDGKWYTITTESIVAEANPEYWQPILAAMEADHG